MKIVKYGKGMKLRKGYLTECGCCHTIFMAAPTDVEFLWRNDDPVEFPTPTYRTYCPVCGDTRIYQVRDDKKKRKMHINDMLVITISTVIVTLLCEVLPGMTGGTIRILLNALVIVLLVVILIAHDE